ncbi:MAG: outer membrane protein assembly factor BamB family protein [Thermoplasmatota archaeon]
MESRQWASLMAGAILFTAPIVSADWTTQQGGIGRTGDVALPHGAPWRFDLGTNGANEYSPLALANDTVFFKTEFAGLYAFNATDGALRWHDAGDVGYEHDLLVEGGQVLWANGTTIELLQASTGKPLWKNDLTNRSIQPQAIGDGAAIGIVYPAQPGTTTTTFEAFSLDTGHALWAHPVVNTSWYGGAIGWRHAAILFANGTLLAYNMTTGDPLWNLSILTPSFNRSSVGYLAADGTTLFLSAGGDLRAFAMEDPTQAPKLSWLSAGHGGTFPIVENDSVYVGSLEGNIWSMNATNGDVRWSLPLSLGVQYTGAIDGNRTFWATAPFIANATGHANWTTPHRSYVLAVDARNGDILWNRTTGAYVSAPLAAGGNLVFFRTFEGGLVALNETTGAGPINAPPSGGPWAGIPSLSSGMVVLALFLALVATLLPGARRAR